MDGSMDGRVECRVFRRSGGGREVAEVEVWMDGGMECVVLRRSRSKWKGQRGDGVQEEVNGGDGVDHQPPKREWGVAVRGSTFHASTMRHLTCHLNFSQRGKIYTTHHTPSLTPPQPTKLEHYVLTALRAWLAVVWIVGCVGSGRPQVICYIDGRLPKWLWLCSLEERRGSRRSARCVHMSLESETRL